MTAFRIGFEWRVNVEVCALRDGDCRLTYRFAFRPKKETPLSQDEILAIGIFSMDNQ